MLNLKWAALAGGDYASLDRVILTRVTTIGVYIIWHGGPAPRVVRVGQGDVADRLCVHRLDDEILAFGHDGLYVTWAAVPATSIDGVERYLAETLAPIVGDRFPSTQAIPVNLPWAA
ncbi:hypothetical protein [Terricaulis silvestris]|uniref:Uncharacterized protein n=1 Tax=Terricaulis silvestris TaxID=2686094 RepID=A0A6I6MQW4_9CAUL|nr:hypothetical protein [Terricaulis silvestris]QGZ95818.1 hypothetical protein DSM104635_02670 [Terricaulis silvestris]